MNTERHQGSRKNTRAATLPEVLIILGLGVLVYLLSLRYDIMERIVRLSTRYEHLEIDEMITVSVYLMFALLFFSIRRWKEARRASALLSQRNEDLEKALSEVRQLRGMITICSVCKRVKSDDGFWQQIEVYIRDHSEADFSHGICRDCAKKLYPEFDEDEQFDQLS